MPRITAFPFVEPALDEDPRIAPERLTFFFSGFDPKGAAFYYRLFRDGAAQRNATHPEQLGVGARQHMGHWASAWSVSYREAAHEEGRPMRTRVYAMRWDDIVRCHWSRTMLQLVRDYWNVYALGIMTGVFSRIRRQAPAAFWLGLFPLGIAFGFLAAGGAGVGSILWAAQVMSLVPALFCGCLAGLVAWRLAARWIDYEWLLRLYAFTRLQAMEELPSLEQRQDEMASHLVDSVVARLAVAAAPPLREILLVGYSTGSVLAASVLARAASRLERRLAQEPARCRPALSMLTLGHCVPVAAEWKAARRLRDELRQLSDCASLTWHDYSAPSDWAAFWRTPPWPLPARLMGYQASPRFHQQLSAAHYASLRRNRRELHLQYLRPPMRWLDSEAYDYFRLVAGTQTLAERHRAKR